MATNLGNPAMANVIALGTVVAKSGIVKVESVEAILKKSFKEKLLKMNLAALHKSVELVAK
jgi:2-oxoglutarate ferredoxin oxidoreductase subunit gamma